MLQRPLAQGAVVLLWYEVYMRYPTAWLFLVPAALILVGYLLWWWLETMRDEKEQHWYLCALSLLFVLASVVAVATPEYGPVRHVIAVAAASFHVFLGQYLRAMRGDIRTRSPLLVHVATVLVILILFFSGAFFHSLSLQFGLRTIGLLLCSAAAQLSVILLYFRALHVPIRQLVVTGIAAALVVVETFWIVEFLPHAAFTRSMFQMISLVLFLLLERDRVLNQFDVKRSISRAGTGLLILVAILFITRWS